MLADLNRAIARRVRSRPHRCTARATSPTSASVRVRSGDCKRSAYARLRARSPDRRPPVHVEKPEVGEQRARGITQGSLDVACRDHIRNDERQVDVRRREPADWPVPSLDCGRANSRSSSSCTHATRSTDAVGVEHARIDLTDRAEHSVLAEQQRPGGVQPGPLARGDRHVAPVQSLRRSRPRRLRGLRRLAPASATPRISRSSGSGSPGCGNPNTWPISNSATPVVAVRLVVGDRLDSPGSSDVRSTDSSATSGFVIEMPRRLEAGAAEVARSEERDRHRLGGAEPDQDLAQQRAGRCCDRAEPARMRTTSGRSARCARSRDAGDLLDDVDLGRGVEPPRRDRHVTMSAAGPGSTVEPDRLEQARDVVDGRGRCRAAR